MGQLRPFLDSNSRLISLAAMAIVFMPRAAVPTPSWNGIYPGRYGLGIMQQVTGSDPTFGSLVGSRTESLSLSDLQSVIEHFQLGDLTELIQKPRPVYVAECVWIVSYKQTDIQAKD